MFKYKSSLHTFFLKFCSCKNTCSKGSGRKRRGCPCRDEGLKCSQHCSCGTAKADCKNKPAAATWEASNTNAGRNAFERHEIAVTEAKQEITVSPINIQKMRRYKPLEILYTKVITWHNIFSFSFDGVVIQRWTACGKLSGSCVCEESPI